MSDDDKVVELQTRLPDELESNLVIEELMFSGLQTRNDMLVAIRQLPIAMARLATVKLLRDCDEKQRKAMFALIDGEIDRIQTETSKTSASVTELIGYLQNVEKLAPKELQRNAATTAISELKNLLDTFDEFTDQFEQELKQI